MRILSSTLLTLGAVIVLILSLVSVLRDLLARGPHRAPLLEDDGLAWPRRYQGVADSVDQKRRFAAPSSTWGGGRERSGTSISR
jgi:hypothetical protein